jgi:D-alanyl-D-alanine carboxypeptidase/D-alanyl-D-alanine-endopeptidase (penicillin-binding protein 4)
VLPGVTWINLVTTGKIGSEDNAYIYAAPNSNTRDIRGTIPAGVAEFNIKGALPDPALCCVQTLLQAIQARSIRVTGSGQILTAASLAVGVPMQRQLISTTYSPRLTDLVFWLNKKSINLYAEQLLKVLGKKFENEGSYAAGIKVLKKFLQEQQIPLTGLFLQDGSGLSRYNGISTGQLTLLLVKMLKTDCFPAFYRSLPIAGEPTDNGTIRNWCRGTPAAKNARVKTGQIERVRSHAGYVKNAAGHLIAFAIIANDFASSAYQIDQLHQQIVVKLAQLK